MKQVKHEVIDLEYEDNWKSTKGDEEALLIAQKIKEEYEVSRRESSPPIRLQNQENQRCSELRVAPPAPLVFDHFICMRIGLNSHNNVQRLMALLTAHDFVDLTVLPTPSMQAQPIPLLPIGLLKKAPSRLPPCSQEPTTSSATDHFDTDGQRKTAGPIYKPRKCLTRKVVTRVQSGDNCGLLPVTLKCRKCSEIIPKGTSASLALIHVQKAHLKMSAFQCRICKHYRTTHERIQSHVTTVHKARSNKFDSSLAGPLSESDMRRMEEMITHCFPPLSMELQVTDRLAAKKFHIDPSLC